jgi:hypothetical protein
MEPFDSYPTWLRENPRCLGGGSCRTGYGLLLQRITKLQRHQHERRTFDSRPWEKDINPDTLPRRP